MMRLGVFVGSILIAVCLSAEAEACSTVHCITGACDCSHPAQVSPAGFPQFDPPPPEEGVVDVLMQDYLFFPETVTVSPGMTVRWTNLDLEEHDTVSRNTVWASEYLSPGTSFSFQFPEEALGDYFYDCTLHGGMSGRVIVIVPEPFGMLSALLLAVFLPRRRTRC
jgi:plastocyanin